MFPVFKLQIMMCLERTIDFFNSRVGATFQSTLINFTGKTSEAVPIPRWRSLKTRLYLLGLPSTLIRNENGALRKRSSDWRNLKTPAFPFRVDGKTVWKRGLSKTMTSQYSSDVVSLKGVFSSNTNPKWLSGDCWVFKFFRSSASSALKQMTLLRKQN